MDGLALERISMKLVHCYQCVAWSRDPPGYEVSVDRTVQPAPVQSENGVCLRRAPTGSGKWPPPTRSTNGCCEGEVKDEFIEKKPVDTTPKWIGPDPTKPETDPA